MHELGARLLDSRKVGTPLETLARDLFSGFHDICTSTGLDRVLAELEVDVTDRTALAENEALFSALVAKLSAVDPDGGGPRNAKPAQLADSVVAALGLTLVDTVEPVTTFDETVRAEVAAALASVIDVELAVPRIREAIIAKGRGLCDERFLFAYDKMVAHLDERGLKLQKQLKIPLDADHAVQRILVDARHAVIGGAARTAIDRAKKIIERVDAEAGARIDLPISHKLTPRDVAIERVVGPRVPKVPAAVVASLLGSLGELARFAWRAPLQTVRPYAASQTFAVGELLEHPKFGRGSVISTEARRIEVEFPDGRHTLVHVPPSK